MDDLIDKDDLIGKEDLIDKNEAQRIRMMLLNSPHAPGVYSHFINVGTNDILDILDRNYFEGALAEGISCFKYLQGYYGSGKTQFINSLATRAWRKEIVTSIVNVGNECPFNSPLAIYKSIVSSFLPPPVMGKEPNNEKGIEVLIYDWIKSNLRKNGIGEGHPVPDAIRAILEKPFTELLLGAKDMQAASGIKALGKTLLDYACGANQSPADAELIQWLRGDRIRSSALSHNYGLSTPADDTNAFNRLKTIITFLRNRMGYRGFLIAFDEGTRTASFRRGTVKQRQAIENMVTMINENAEGEFSGVMFLYSATPDFKAEVISKYPALDDRIGKASFSPGRPMVPFIDLDSLNTDDIAKKIGKKLLEVFALAHGISWDEDMQSKNVDKLIEAEKRTYGLGSEIRRAFVYHFCMFLDTQSRGQGEISDSQADELVKNHILEKEDI
jgi:hypothetical protein